MSHYGDMARGEKERHLVEKYAPHFDPSQWSEWDLKVLFAEKQEAVETLRDLRYSYNTIARLLKR